MQNNNASNVKKEKHSTLARDLGLSKSLFSRAANHCSRVDADTHRMVLSELNRKSAAPDGQCSIYTIQPDIPHYFWDQAYRGICAGLGDFRECKQNIYTAVTDTDLVQTYLDEAERLDAQVILIAAWETPEIVARLSDISRNRRVFFLTEYMNIPNTFYFGADSYADGHRLGQIFCERYADRIPLILNINSTNISRRISGFCDALRTFDSKRFSSVPLLTVPVPQDNRTSRAPYRLASFLRGQVDRTSEYCFYVPYGFIGLPQALAKAGLDSRTVCLLHDYEPIRQDETASVVAACINQDIFAQSEAAVRAAVEYVTTGNLPSQKYTHIPSKVILPTEAYINGKSMEFCLEPTV